MPRLSRNSQSSLSPTEIMSLADDSVVSVEPEDSLLPSSRLSSSLAAQASCSSASTVSQVPGSLGLSSPGLASFWPSVPGPAAGISSLFGQTPVRFAAPRSSPPSVGFPPRFPPLAQPRARLSFSPVPVASSTVPSYVPSDQPVPLVSLPGAVDQSITSGTTVHDSLHSSLPPFPSVSGIGVSSLDPARGSYPVAQGVSAPASSSLPDFVVGPGFPPVSGKLVSAIVSGAFVELALLLEDPSDVEDPSFSLWDDRLVLRPRRKRKQITDIVAWVQAFGIYTLVMCSYFPHRAPDLTRYNLLILRTSQQFPGSSWLAYDRAFRREAAARRLLDWSRMNSDLFNFHTATAATSTQPSAGMPRPVWEASGTPSSPSICRSWNAGRCSSSYQLCRFRHSCDFPGCTAVHRRSLVHAPSEVGAHRRFSTLPSQEPRKRPRQEWSERF